MRIREHIIQRDGMLPLRLQGDVIGFAENEKMILLLFKTETGKIVGEKITLASAASDERRAGAVCASRLDLSKFFGTSALAREFVASIDSSILPVNGFEDV